MNLPKYKSHKVVEAFKIKTIYPRTGGGATLVPSIDEDSRYEVSDEYLTKHDPKFGGYYVRYEDGYESFSSAQAFENGYSAVGLEKTLHNTTASKAKDNVKDIIFWGDGDTFKLISKASSKAEGWMKSTKAMEIPGIGCVVQVTTQQHSRVAEALTFVPGVKITKILDEEGKVRARTLEAIGAPGTITGP